MIDLNLLPVKFLNTSQVTSPHNNFIIIISDSEFTITLNSKSVSQVCRWFQDFLQSQQTPGKWYNYIKSQHFH